MRPSRAKGILQGQRPEVPLHIRNGLVEQHQRSHCLVSELAAVGLRLLATWPCVVEASHLLDVPPTLPNAAFDRVGRSSSLSLRALSFRQHDHLDATVHQSDKREMDLADTPLYWLAAETGIMEIITVDRNDFERYRLPDGGKSSYFDGPKAAADVGT